MHICKSKKPGICLAYGCKNKHLGYTHFCSKHKRQKQKENNPLRYYYDVLKQNAKRRHKVFLLTFDYWIDFCNRTGYLDAKGRKANDLTVDRISENLGYIDGNIQVLKNGDNVRKMHHYKMMNKESGSSFDYAPIDTSDIQDNRQQAADFNDIDLPF